MRGARLTNAGHALRRVLATAAVAAAVTSCTNAPPPPLVTTEVPRTEPTRPVNPREAVVGVDSVAGGYNPHKLSDQSALTTALSAVLLPSVFRTGPDGADRLDTSLMVSAEVTSAEPYTVTYRLRPEASWSDGAPIAAEDFVYLWERLRTEPGVNGGAGYRLIDGISAREAGRVVEVVFTKPYPGWRSLFAHLLPAHLLKDIPGGWTNVLRENHPVTGGPFSLRTVDRDRGEIVLERNDRYWDPPAALDRIILRRGDVDTVAAALRSGHDQLAISTLDPAGVAAMAALGPLVARQTVPRPTVVSVLLRPVSPAMADVDVRTAIAALLDRAALTAAATQGGPQGGLPANAQLTAPSTPGYAATGPGGGPDPARAETLLTQAGYTKTAATWGTATEPMELVVGAPADRPAYVAVAREVQRQLTASGIASKLITPTAAELFTDLPVTASAPPVDIVVAPLPAGGDPATDLATRFGCVEGEAKTMTPANLVGFCDPVVQAAIDAAVTGAAPMADTRAALEPRLWALSLALPLYQESDELVVRSDMAGIEAGPPMAGPFETAAAWRRAGK